jgi:sulfur carrier protein ThiS
MIVKIAYRGKEYDANTGSTLRDAVKKIGLQPETVLAVVDGKLVTDDTIIREGMTIRLVAVISGGAA